MLSFINIIDYLTFDECNEKNKIINEIRLNKIKKIDEEYEKFECTCYGNIEILLIHIMLIYPYQYLKNIKIV